MRQYVYAGAACKSATTERSRREPTDLDLETEPDSTERSSSHTNAASSLALVKVSNGNGLTSTRVGLLHTINAMAAMTTVARQRQASTTSFIFGKSRRNHRRSTQMTNLQQSFDIGDGESDLEECCEFEHKNGESFEKQRLAYDSSLQTIPEKDVLSNTPAGSNSGTAMAGLKPGVEPHDAETAFTAGNYNSCAKPQFYLPLVNLNSTASATAVTDSTDNTILPSNALSDDLHEHDSDSQTYHLQRLVSSSTYATNYLRQSSSATTAVTMDTLDDDCAFSPEQEIDLIDADDTEVTPAEVSDQFIQQSHSHHPLQRLEFSDSSYAGANTTNSLSTHKQIATGDVVRHLNVSASPTRNLSSSSSAYQQCEINSSSDLQGTCNRLKHEHSGHTLLGKTDRFDNNVKQTLTTKQTPDQTRNRGSWSLQTVFGVVQLSNVLRPRTRQSSRSSRSIDSKRDVGMETSRGSRSQATTEQEGGGKGGGGEGSRARGSSGGAMPQSALLRQAMRWRKKMETSRHHMSSALAKEIKVHVFTRLHNPCPL